MFSTSIVSPIARLGVGMYNWSILDDGIGGEVIKNGNEDFKATSFGANVSIGADFKIASNFTIGIIADYNIYFPKDENKFGKDFAEQGFVTTQLKLSYNLPVK